MSCLNEFPKEPPDEAKTFRYKNIFYSDEHCVYASIGNEKSYDNISGCWEYEYIKDGQTLIYYERDFC